MIQTVRRLLGLLSLIALAFLSTGALRATISVTLSPSPGGPQPVGTMITWTATVQDSAPGAHEFQFSVGPANGPLAIVQDFTSFNTFQWAAGEGGTGGVFTMTEGSYQVSVVAQNTSNNTASAPAARTLAVTTRLKNGLDSVASTANPLVALFSAQKCLAGNVIRVRFNQKGALVIRQTNSINRVQPHQQCELLRCGNVSEYGIPDASRNPLRRHHPPHRINADIYNRRHSIRRHFSSDQRSDTGRATQ